MSDLTRFAIVTMLPLFLACCGSSAPSDPDLDSLNESVANLSANSADATQSNASNLNVSSAQERRIAVRIRNLAGEPEQDAYLVDKLADTTPEKIEDAVREASYACTSVKGFYQLEQKGELIDIYKIDCSEGSYQLTAMNGNTFFKRWTGNMMGSTE